MAGYTTSLLIKKRHKYMVHYKIYKIISLPWDSIEPVVSFVEKKR